MTEDTKTPPPHQLGEMLAFLGEHTDDLLCVADAKTMRFLWLSPGWPKTLGWSEEELLSRSYVDFVHPDDMDATAGESESLSSGSTTLFFENRYRHKDGHWVWLRWSALSHPGGISYNLARDVSAFKANERQQRQQAKLLELAAEIANLGHWRIDLLTNELTWSDEVYRIHGLDPRTHIPTVDNAIEAYHPEDRDRVAACVASAIENREPFDFELRLLHSTGSIRQVVAKGRIETDDGGTPTAVFGIFLDVTEAREMERQLQLAERMSSLGTLAAGLAHELNNPLTYVFGHLDELSRSTHNRPAERMLIEELTQGAEHMRDVIAGLGAFARSGVRETRVVELGEVVDVALQLCRHQVRHAGELKIERDDPLPSVRGNGGALAQVVVNLLINAARALPPEQPDKRVTLRVRTEGGAAVIEIEDNGVGIPPELQDKVFEPFFTTREVGQGTGLGLSICHGIVESHHGQLTVDSRPGHTVFRVQLPVASTLASTDPESTPVSVERTRVRILVVDDSEVVAAAMSTALQRIADVAVETSGQDALARLLDEPFELVVCDIMMPGMTGWQLTEELVKTHSDIEERMLYVTGGAFSPEAARFVEGLPERRLLKKPFPPSALRERVVELLGDTRNDDGLRRG